MATSNMAEQVGRVLDGRYRVLSPLGSGVSAEVYLGDDVRLHRRVAIKLLHPALAGDESFLRRFRAEARAAAALSHPNLMAVYDWSGNTGEQHASAPAHERAPAYLVMEYLRGGSLRAILDEGKRLTPSQALVVGLQVAQGLDVAHRQGLVHRDITPGNLLFGGDGRLRVADFGLARAVAEAALTEPSGAMMGTARYASPEQVLGGSLDGRSDIYALCLVLVEAVTGRVPFTADTTAATLMARREEPVPVPEQLSELKPVLERMGALDPADRPDAAELIDEFMSAATRLPRPASLPLATGTGPGLGDVGSDRTVVAGMPMSATGPGSPATAQQPAVTDIPAPALASAPSVPPAPPAPGPMPGHAPVPGPGESAGVGGGHHPGGYGDGPEQWGPAGEPAPAVTPMRAGARRQVPSWTMPTLLVAIALLVGVLGTWYILDASVPSHMVPQSLIGADVGQLDDLIGDRGWRRETVREYAEGSEVDEILLTDPAPGNELRDGGTLHVVVSCGPSLAELPEGLEGMQQSDAEELLQSVGLEPDVRREVNDDIPAGEVTAVAVDTVESHPECEDEAGSGRGLVPGGATVELEVSDGPDTEAVPDLAGWDEDDAVRELEALGFEVDVSRSRNRDVDRGQVIRTNPEPGTQLEEGDEVEVVVSRGQRGRGRGRGRSNNVVTVPSWGGETRSWSAGASYW